MAASKISLRRKEDRLVFYSEKLDDIGRLLSKGASHRDISAFLGINASSFSEHIRKTSFLQEVIVRDEERRKVENAKRIEECQRVCIVKCTGPCGKILPFSEFYNDSKTILGIQHQCRQCTDAYATARKEKNKIKNVLRDEKDLSSMYENCSSCGEIKPVSEFPSDAGRLKGVSCQCKKCQAKTGKARRDVKFDDDHIQFKITAILGAARQRSKSEGVPFSITREDVYSIYTDHCKFLDIPLNWHNRGRPAPNSPSLDKIIPGQGYVPGNCQIISYRANMLKSNATVEELSKVVEGFQRLMWGASVVEMMC